MISQIFVRRIQAIKYFRMFRSLTRREYMRNNKVLLNYIYNAFYQILLMIMPLITSPYISRVLGSENIGIYSYTYSVVFYFGIFAYLGISEYGNRAVAKVRDDKEKLSFTFSSVFYLHFILSILIIIIYLVYVMYAVKNYKTIAYIQVIYLFSVLFDISWFFFGIEEFKLTVGRNTIIKILTTISIFVFVKSKSDLWIYTGILTAGTLLSSLSLWMFVSKYTKFVKVSIESIFVHIKPMTILVISSVAVSIYLYIDKIMIGNMSSMSQVGYYENSFKMIQFPLGLITAMGTVMLPHMSRIIANEGVDRAKLAINDSMKIISLISPAFAFGLAAISNVFSVIFWGDDFAECGPILSLLSITAVLISWNNIIRTEYLIPTERDKKYVLAVCFGAVTDIILNIIFIPLFGGLGAAVGTVGAYFMVFIVQNIAANKELDVFRYLSGIFPFCIIGFVMFVGIRYIGAYVSISWIGLLVRILLGVFILL